MLSGNYLLQMLKNNYILKDKMLYKLLGYFTYTCCKFTYHVVNIKQDVFKNKLNIDIEFTYHIVNIKLLLSVSKTLGIWNLHTT